MKVRDLEVVVLPTAVQNLDDATSYTSHKLFNPSSAHKLVDAFNNKDLFFTLIGTMKDIWGEGFVVAEGMRVFLSHSSKDKAIIDIVYNELQKSGVSAWYDKYQIEPGDRITSKINEGLDMSDIGIICISNSFLNSDSGWTETEQNYFFQRKMRDSTSKFIVLNIDVPHKNLPPLLQDYRYIDYQSDGAISTLIDALKKNKKI